MQTEKLDFVRLISEGCPTERFSQCYGSIAIFQTKLLTFTPYQQQNFRPVKPSAFGQVKEIVYLKENYENCS